MYMWPTPRKLYNRLYCSHTTASTNKAHAPKRDQLCSVFILAQMGGKGGGSTFCSVCGNNFKASILGCFKYSKVFEAVHHRKPLNLITQIVVGSFSQLWR